MKKDYIFVSERLGFRNWSADDLDGLVQMNADKAVMEHFPNVLSRDETVALFQRLQEHFEAVGYTYYATDILETGEFIGFIGLAYQKYETPFTPATDIGWRLKPSAWGKGYATEGAKRCLEFAFQDLKLDRVISTCTAQNVKSEKVMQKIGMTKIGALNHPNLKDYPAIEHCFWYELKST